MKEQCESPSDIRRNKHTELDRSIDSIDNVIGRLTSLSDRISGVDSDDREAEEEPCRDLSLESVLLNAPPEIREKSERALKLIADIESKLF